jgi:hypothetical protein
MFNRNRPTLAAAPIAAAMGQWAMASSLNRTVPPGASG